MLEIVLNQYQGYDAVNYLIISIIVAMGILTAIILLVIYTSPEEKTMKVINTDFSIGYMNTEGKVLGSKADLQAKALIVSIQTASDGKLTLAIP